MKLSTRFGLIGIGALALLSLVHWLRDAAPPRQPATAFLLGVTPNFAAAIAMTFVLLSIWADQHRDATLATAKRPFLVCASITALGLTAWEFVQKSSRHFVFDAQDVAATLVGIGTATLLFYALTPSAKNDAS